MFSGEGLFSTTLTGNAATPHVYTFFNELLVVFPRSTACPLSLCAGPGKIILQSMPIDKLRSIFERPSGETIQQVQIVLIKPRQLPADHLPLCEATSETSQSFDPFARLQGASGEDGKKKKKKKGSS